MILLTATAMHALYEKNYKLLMKIGRLYHIPEIEIEDIINQIFLDFAEKQIDFSGISKPDAYVTTSFKRKLIDFYRKKKSSKINSLVDFENLQFEEVPLGLEDNEIQTQNIEKLYKLFKKIPPRCQKVIFLKYYRYLSNEKIASETGLSIQTIYNNLSEGIKKLRNGFEDKSKPSVFSNPLEETHSNIFVIPAILIGGLLSGLAAALNHLHL
jgi:RNA polymerase sigma factor (sigma-70 family)